MKSLSHVSHLSAKCVLSVVTPAADRGIMKNDGIPGTSTEIPETEPLSGHRRYDILDRMPLGRLGVVLRARDRATGLPTTLVAVDAGSPEAAQTLARRAQRAALLGHPNLAPPLDVMAEGDALLMALPQLDGPLFSAVLRAGALPLDALVGYAQALASALACAHAAGLVHGALGLDSIIVEPDDRLRITDLALGAHGAQADTQYLSPEQRKGWPADAQSDVFAFGAILQTMLRGARTSSTAATLHEDLKRLAQRCTEEAAVKRPWDGAALVMELRRAIEIDKKARFSLGRRSIAPRLERAPAMPSVGGSDLPANREKASVRPLRRSPLPSGRPL